MTASRHGKGKDYRLSREVLAQISKHDSRLLSPIDLSIDDAKPLYLKPLKWINFYEPPLKMALKNSGDTVMVIARWDGQRPYLTGSHIQEDDYIFSQIHFHWDTLDHHKKYKHTILGLSCPLEMHAVFYKSCYKNEAAARDKDDGVLIIVYFFKEEERSSLSWLTRALEKVHEPLMVTSLPPVPLCALMVPFTRDYLMYWGALCCACPHAVQWIIARTSLGISHNELRMFRKLQTIAKETTSCNTLESKSSNRSLFHISPCADKRHLLLPKSVEPPCQISLGSKTIVITMYYRPHALVKQANSGGSGHDKTKEDSIKSLDMCVRKKSHERDSNFGSHNSYEILTENYKGSEVTNKLSEISVNRIKKLSPTHLKQNILKHDNSTKIETETEEVASPKSLRRKSRIHCIFIPGTLGLETEKIPKEKKEDIKFIMDAKRKWAKNQRAKINASKKLLEKEKNIVANMRKKLLRERAEKYIMKLFLDGEVKKYDKKKTFPTMFEELTEFLKFNGVVRNEMGDVLEKETVLDKSGEKSSNTPQIHKEIFTLSLTNKEEANIENEENQNRTGGSLTKHRVIGNVTEENTEVENKFLISGVNKPLISSPKSSVKNEETKKETLATAKSSNEDKNTNNTIKNDLPMSKTKRQQPKSKLPMPVGTLKRPKAYTEVQSSLYHIFNSPLPPERKYTGRQEGVSGKPNPKRNVPEQRADMSCKESKNYRQRCLGTEAIFQS